MKKTPEEIAQGLVDRQRAALAKAAPMLARDIAARRAMEMLEKDGSVTITDLLASFEATAEKAGTEAAVMERAVIDYLRSLAKR